MLVATCQPLDDVGRGFILPCASPVKLSPKPEKKKGLTLHQASGPEEPACNINFTPPAFVLWGGQDPQTRTSMATMSQRIFVRNVSDHTPLRYNRTHQNDSTWTHFWFGGEELDTSGFRKGTTMCLAGTFPSVKRGGHGNIRARTLTSPRTLSA